MLPKDTPILIVDDHFLMRQTVKNILVGDGYTEICTACNGQEALTKLKERLNTRAMFKVIFLDWNMPEMDGLTFLRICRNDFHLEEVAIIMLTANAEQKDVITALGSGVTAYITKPMSRETILQRMKQLEAWFASIKNASKS